MVPLLLFSTALQIAATVLALRAPRSLRTRFAWWTLAAASAVIAARRLIVLSGHLSGTEQPPTRMAEEALAATVSALLLFGVLAMRRLWTEADAALAEAQDRERAMREADEELRRSRLRLQEAQRVAGVITFEIDLRNGTMWVSEDPRLPRGSGAGGIRFTLDEGFSFLHPENRDRVVRELAAGTATGGSGDVTVEYRQHSIDDPGQVAVVRSTARAERDGQGNVVRMIGATLDITDIRAAEQEVRELNAELEARVRARTAELERAIEELEAFRYSVSHDLRSPLRAMAGYSDLVEEEDGERLSQASHEHLRRIRASSVRMDGLIDGLLSLARLAQAPRIDTQVDLSRLARGILDDFATAEPGRRVEVRIEGGLTTVADESMMALLMQSLLSNAWKFTRARPEALIEFGRDADGAFFVRDNGVGFDAQQRAKLFRPFERLHRDDEFEGAGIGLATVARIVRRHGGEVSAQGSIGRGATFRFTIAPAASAKPQAA